MADRRAMNKYYPPDWDPSKGSANTYSNSHPLRDRARKIGQGILVVRFEMPFNIWCLKCNNHIAMGVRYNAEKSKVGNYYSTPIYRFNMKCHLCDNHFDIQTDPSKFDYVILSGARKQSRPVVKTGDAEDSNQITIDDEETERRMNDAMLRLERQVEDKIKAESQLPSIHELKQWRTRWEDNFTANQIVRSQYRKRRKNIEAKKASDKQILRKASLRIPLVRTSQADKDEAMLLIKQREVSLLTESESSKRRQILSSKLTFQTVPTIKEKVPMGPVTRTRIKQEPQV